MMPSVKPYVARLFIYPIKSLDRKECDRVEILDSGAIKGDRTWAIFDLKGNFVNGKRNARIHNLRSKFDPETSTLSLKIQGADRTHTFDLFDSAKQQKLCEWLSQFFGFEVKIKKNLVTGFPDDVVSPGATIISTATLAEVASWYPQLNTEDIRSRFRANIEIAGVPPFWEDRLFAEANSTVKFRVGQIEFMGVNPCQRCIVVTRDPQTGKAYPQFQKTFVRERKKTLPEWSERSRFDRFFRLAVNTKLSSIQAGKIMAIGDEVKLC